MAKNKWEEILPTNWLDPMLTGDKKVIGEPPYTCSDIERLILAINKRLDRAEKEGKVAFVPSEDKINRCEFDIPECQYHCGIKTKEAILKLLRREK